MKKIVKISETIVDHIVNEMINVLSYEYYGSLDHGKVKTAELTIGQEYCTLILRLSDDRMITVAEINCEQDTWDILGFADPVSVTNIEATIMSE